MPLHLIALKVQLEYSTPAAIRHHTTTREAVFVLKGAIQLIALGGEDSTTLVAVRRVNVSRVADISLMWAVLSHSARGPYALSRTSGGSATTNMDCSELSAARPGSTTCCHLCQKSPQTKGACLRGHAGHDPPLARVSHVGARRNQRLSLSVVARVTASPVCYARPMDVRPSESGMRPSRFERQQR
jgi:hypothetical protein